jgi:hypothetical protein
VVIVYVGAGTPAPRCVQVRADQHLQVVDRTGPAGQLQKTVAITWPPYPRRTVASGAATVYPRSFGSYLVPGDHVLGMSIDGGAEILLDCRSSQLRLGIGPEVSEATQQNTLVLIIHNISAQPCDLDGYPQAVLFDTRMAALPFGYARGGDQMLTIQPPRIVTLPARGEAYLGLNKNTCVYPDRRIGAFISLRPPGEDRALTLRLGRYPLLDYCGPGDPGHTIDLSPVEPTFRDVLRH